MRALALLLGLASACTDRPLGEDTDATSTSTGTTTQAASTTDPPTTGAMDDPSSTTEAEPPCLEERYNDIDPQSWMLTCGLPELCPGEHPLVFIISTGELREPGTVEVDDLERARCMAAALRDRTLGQFTWWIFAGTEWITTASLEIIAPDTAIIRRVGPSLLSLPAPPNVRERLYPLREPEFFADCAEGDAAQLYQCLLDSVAPECLPGSLGCPK